MNDDIRKAVALLRHQIISPVLMETARGQMAYFRKIAGQEFDLPGHGQKYFKPETMKGWLKAYRKFGFAGIVPKARKDRGTQRFMSDKVSEALTELRRDCLELSVAKFYRKCVAAGILGDPPMCQQTVRRFLQSQKLFAEGGAVKGRKRFEMDRFGELWVGDFMHGPVLEAPKKRKAILLAFIDDYSRMIVGHRWGLAETTLPVEQVFKEALLKFGKADKIYVDNGPSFSSDYLRLVCAKLDIALVHSKPYDSPSRGKIERFWRTVRGSFLPDFNGTTLRELNDAFDIWLRDQYHMVNHAGISCRPIDRYQLSLSEHPRTRVNEDVLEELFLATTTRKVNKDATISFNSLIYEVPAQYIGKRIEIRYRQDNPYELFIYENDQRITAIKVVDARANGKSYKPRERTTVIPFQKENKDA